jgi:hypothetical protein
MNCRQIIRCCLTTVAIISSTPQPQAFAISASPECQATLYQPSFTQGQSSTLTLTASDIIGATQGADGIAEQVDTEQDLLAGQPPFKSSIVSQPLRWQMRVKSEYLNNSPTTYPVMSDSTQGNPLKTADATRSENITTITDCSDGTVVVQSAVSLKFQNLSTFSVKTHQGRIDLCGTNGCP